MKPIWNEIILYINNKEKTNIAPSVSQKTFGIQDDKYLTYIFLLLKCFIYNCKFQDKPLKFDGFKALLKCNNEIEYFIAKKETNLLFISKSGESILVLKIYYSKTYVKRCFEYSSTCTYWLHCLCLLLLCDFI